MQRQNERLDRVSETMEDAIASFDPLTEQMIIENITDSIRIIDSQELEINALKKETEQLRSEAEHKDLLRQEAEEELKEMKMREKVWRSMLQDREKEREDFEKDKQEVLNEMETLKVTLANKDELIQKAEDSQDALKVEMASLKNELLQLTNQHEKDLQMMKKTEAAHNRLICENKELSENFSKLQQRHEKQQQDFEKERHEALSEMETMRQKAQDAIGELNEDKVSLETKLLEVTDQQEAWEKEKEVLVKTNEELKDIIHVKELYLEGHRQYIINMYFVNTEMARKWAEERVQQRRKAEEQALTLQEKVEEARETADKVSELEKTMDLMKEEERHRSRERTDLKEQMRQKEEDNSGLMEIIQELEQKKKKKKKWFRRLFQSSH